MNNSSVHPLVIMNAGVLNSLREKMMFIVRTATKKIHDTIFTFAIERSHSIFIPIAEIRRIAISTEETIERRYPLSDMHQVYMP